MASENKNCELLLEYLKSILSGTDAKSIALKELDEPYQRLGEELLLLEKSIKEMLRYSADLSKGNLSAQPPSEDNFLCENLKTLHSRLNHLTGQLKERERLLKEETEKVEKRAKVIEQYNELFMELTRKRHEWILVVDAETRKIVYCNKKPECNAEYDPSCCKYHLSFQDKLLNWTDADPKNWEMDDDRGLSYQISTLSLIWKGRNSYAHMVLDITEQKQRTQKLRLKAYQDPGTGIRNRLYFEERMDEILESGKKVIFCYLDLDGLKTVNDHFGHLEGDAYIRSFVSVVRKNFRSSDEFARVGGDEFALILFNCSRELALQKLSETLCEFTDSNQKEYIASFSYGIVEVDNIACQRTLEEIIRLADNEMYICKRKHKEKLNMPPR